MDSQELRLPFEKQQKWDGTAKKVNRFRDGLGMKVDDGIKETVIAFNILGFKTRHSCEGHIERAEAAPWIDIQGEENEDLRKRMEQAFDKAEEGEKENISEGEKEGLWNKAHSLREEAEKPLLEQTRRVMTYLSEFYKNRQVAYDRRLTIRRFATFSRLESEGAILQDIAEPEAKKVKLEEYQGEMRIFTSFLKDKFFKG